MKRSIEEEISRAIKINKSELSEELFKDDIRGQILTTKTKHYMYIPLREPYIGNVYKGPFTKKEKRNKILTLRTKIFKILNTKYIVLPEKIIQTNDDWFKYPFIGDITKVTHKEYDLIDEKLKIMVKDKQRLNQLSIKQFEDILFGEQKLIYEILDCMLLRVGDMGPHNMIIDQHGKGYIIDIEDTCGKEIVNVYSLFTRNIKKYRPVIHQLLKNQDIIDYLNERKEKFRIFADEYEKETKINVIRNIETYLSIIC